MKRAVLVICDGHRNDFVTSEFAPNMAALAARGRRCLEHGSIFPCVTRAVSAAIATGCRPRHNGIHGNRVVFEDGGRLSLFDLGKPDFRDVLRRVRGRAVCRPTMAERVADHGGAIVYSNVSPGAAYLQDPDGFGHVFHRSGSSGPGSRPISGLEGHVTSNDLDGDRKLTERFCADVLGQSCPAVSVLWLSNPDKIMHTTPLGSPTHIAAVRAVDACVGMVVEAVDRRRRAGDDILLLVGSDHGHETVGDVVHLDRLLVDAGLKHSIDSSEVVVAPQEFACLVYMTDPAQMEPILAFLREHEWFGEGFCNDGLEAIGLKQGALQLAFTTRYEPQPNPYGVIGSSTLIAADGEGQVKLGNGSHGGFGDHEQNPVLIADTAVPAGGVPIMNRTSVLDIAPTILSHLGLQCDGMDGRPLPLNGP